MLIPQYDKLTDDQEAAWSAVLAAATALPAETGDGRGWLFHGTHHIAATAIMSGGFRDLHDRSLPPESVHVFLGDLDTAVTFARRRMDADSPPCILAVRTSDVAHALKSDDRYEGWVEDWRANVAAGGTVRTTGNVPMPSLRAFGIVGFGLPWHPNAPDRRRERIARRDPIHSNDMINPDAMEVAVLDHEPMTEARWWRELKIGTEEEGAPSPG